jgi:hypothetical protein
VVIRGRTYSVPSVTTALGVLDKPALVPWAINQAIEAIRPAIAPYAEHSESYLEEVYARASKAHREKKSEAAKRGTEVHAILQGAEPATLQLDPSSVSKVEQGLAWLKENNVTFRSIERPIYSRRHRYSGRYDGIADIAGVLTLLDWKTGKGIYPEFQLQTAAYVHAYEEEFPDEVVQQRLCLHLREDSVVPHIYPRSALRQDFNAFLAALRLHRRLKEIQQEEKLSQKKQKEGLI